MAGTLTMSLKRYLFRKAQRMAPGDTWNLRLNAMVGKKWNDKHNFQIHYSGFAADYVQYLEEKEFAGGSKTKKNQHRYFIERTAEQLRLDVIRHFDGYGRGMRTGRFLMREQREIDRQRMRREYVYERSMKRSRSL